MPLGPAVRALFGRHERRIADLYRSIFLNLTDLGEKISTWAAEPRRILEVGCGEGAVTEILAEAFPHSEILAIDITPRAGRMYRGRSEGVQFRETAVQAVADAQPESFDLVLLSDVIHHIPHEMRPEILAAIATSLAPGGRFVLKDWSKSATLIHWLCHAGDRWLTGDRVAHLSPEQAKLLVSQHAPKLQPVDEGRIRPWRNNYVIVFTC